MTQPNDVLVERAIETVNARFPGWLPGESQLGYARAVAAAALEASGIEAMREALEAARPYVDDVARGEGTMPQIVVAEAVLNTIDAALNQVTDSKGGE